MSDRVQKISSNINTPAIIDTAGTAIASNDARVGFMVQNCGTNPLFVRLGSGASTSLFHVVLQAGTGNDDGKGGIFSMFGSCVYTGIVTAAGTSPRFVVTEIAP